MEDDANIMSSLQAKLSLADFDCRTSNGNLEVEEIMREITSYNPDYLIIDLILPKIDGFNVAKAIKADEDLKYKVLFVFTSLGDSDTREKSERLGVDYFFTKSDLGVDGFVEKFINIIKNKEKK